MAQLRDELPPIHRSLGPQARDDLLRDREAIARAPTGWLDLAGRGPSGEHRRLLEVVVVETDHRPMDRLLLAVAAAADPLDETTYLVRRAQLDHVIDLADVDAELERARRDQAAQSSFPEGDLRLLAHLPRERSVVNGHREVRREAMEPRRDPFRGGPRVHEDERRAMTPDLLLQLAEDRHEVRVGPQLGDDFGRKGIPVDPRSLGLQFDRPAHRRGPDLDRAGVRAEEAGHILRVSDGGRQTDPTDGSADPRIEPFQSQRKLRAAVRGYELVDLVDDDGADPAERLAQPLPHEKDLEGLRGREQKIRRPAGLGQPLGRRGVAVTDRRDEAHILREADDPVLEVSIQGP